MNTDTRDCTEHDALSEEFLALADLLAQRLQPWAEQLRTDVAAETDNVPNCAWCPVCAVIGLLRGQRPELAARLTEHGAGLLAALREVLAAPPAGSTRPDNARPETTPPGGEPEGRDAHVQHVTVYRAAGRRAAEPPS